MKILSFLLIIFLFNLHSFASEATHERAIFAGGCFWCMEPPFEKLPGVIKVTAGYAGGSKENPTYEQVSSGVTEHVEAVEIIFDAHKISYEQLLKIFWKNVNPLDDGGQFCDRGDQYKSAIFPTNKKQQIIAEESKDNLQQSKRFIDKKIVTDIKSTSVFYPAEDFHQDYYKHHSIKYKFYRFTCGRDKTLRKVWGD